MSKKLHSIVQMLIIIFIYVCVCAFIGCGTNIRYKKHYQQYIMRADARIMYIIDEVGNSKDYSTEEKCLLLPWNVAVFPLTKSANKIEALKKEYSKTALGNDCIQMYANYKKAHQAMFHTQNIEEILTLYYNYAENYEKLLITIYKEKTKDDFFSCDIKLGFKQYHYLRFLYGKATLGEVDFLEDDCSAKGVYSSDYEWCLADDIKKLPDCLTYKGLVNELRKIHGEYADYYLIEQKYNYALNDKNDTKILKKFIKKHPEEYDAIKLYINILRYDSLNGIFPNPDYKQWLEAYQLMEYLEMIGQKMDMRFIGIDGMWFAGF